MAFSDLLGDISQDGFKLGTLNYLGNQTGVGKTVNEVGGLLQDKGSPQLIGQSTNSNIPHPVLDPSKHLSSTANADGSFNINDDGKKFMDDHAANFSNPTSAYVPLPSSGYQDMSKGKQSSGIGKLLTGIV